MLLESYTTRHLISMQFYLPSEVYREHRACLILADDSCFPVLLRCDRVCLVSPRFSGFLFSLAFSFAGFRWRVLSNVLFTVQSVDRDWNHFQHSESIDFDANSLRRSLEYFMDLWRLLCIYIYCFVTCICRGFKCTYCIFNSLRHSLEYLIIYLIVLLS